jgi:hypothetical protein
MMLCAGYAGGSLPYADKLDKEVIVFGRKINFTWVPELLLVIPLGFLVPWYLSLFTITWSYLWMQSATAPALHWGQGGYNPDRTSTLKPFVDFWAIGGKVKIPAIKKIKFKGYVIHFNGFGYHPNTVQYCRLYMFVKWFLICLPTGFLAPVGAVGAVLAYEGGARFKWPHGVTECLSALALSVCVALAL